MPRMTLPGLVLALLVQGCGYGPTSRTADLSTLPICEEQIVGVRSKTLEDHSVAEIKGMAESLGWNELVNGKEVVAVERAPRLINQRQVSRALEDHFPTDLRDRGVGGSVHFLVWFDPEGNIVRRTIARGAAHPAFNRAAVEVMSVMDFSPAATETCRVPFLGEFAVTFEVAAVRPGPPRGR